MRVRAVVVKRMALGMCIMCFWGMVLAGGGFGEVRCKILEL